MRNFVYIGTALLLTIGIGMVLFFISFSPPLLLFLLLLLCIILIPLCIARPYITLALLIITRNIVDIFADTTLFVVQSIPFNLAALFGMAILPWSIFIILKRFSSTPQLPFHKTPILVPWMGFIVLALLSVYYSYNAAETLTNVLKIIDFAALYTVTYALVRNKQTQRIVWWILASSLIIPSIVALIQWATNTGLSVAGIENRVFGTFYHPNALGFSLVLAIAVVGILAKQYSSKKIIVIPRIVTNALMVLFLLSLTFTFTRGAWIGCAIVGIAWMTVRIPRVTLTISAITLLLFGIMVYNNFSLSSVLPYTLTKYQIIQRVLPETDEETGSLLWRKRIWQETFPAFFIHPVRGYGFGTFPDVHKPLAQYDTDLASLEAHNDYLRILIELGIVGTMLYLLLYVSLIRNIVLLWFSKNIDRAPIVMYSALLVAVLVMSAADNLIRVTPFEWMFWVLSGSIMAMRKPDIIKKHAQLSIYSLSKNH